MPSHIQTNFVVEAGQIMPVVVLKSDQNPVETARSLVAKGYPAVEVTLRTEGAIDAILQIAEHVPEAIVGAGTVLSPQQMSAVKRAGGQFAVAPGASRTLIDAAARLSMPFIPGAATPSEMMQLAEIGFQNLKFFPAEQSGGAPFLRSLSAPLPHVRFCATGGVNADNLNDYLRLPNVVCVGGSWVV
mgnify:CR=1 FL=1